MTVVVVRFFAGPEDGAEKRMTLPLPMEFQYPSPVFDWRPPGSEVSVRTHRLYRYQLDASSEHPIFRYIGETLEPSPLRGGGKLGIRKHGVGEVLSEDQDLTKEASKEWTAEDEQDLRDEE